MPESCNNTTQKICFINVFLITLQKSFIWTLVAPLSENGNFSCKTVTEELRREIKVHNDTECSTTRM